MPARLDWECPKCGARRDDHIATSQDDPPPPCPEGCLVHMIVDWSGGGPANNLFKDGGFDFKYDNGAVVHASTLADVRAIERNTELLHKSGVDQRPIRFRDYSQDKSNRSQNLFGDPPPEARQKAKTRNSRGVPYVGGAMTPPKDKE